MCKLFMIWQLRLQEMVTSLLQSFAATGPDMELSPDTRRKTCLGGDLPEPSPNSKSKRAGAFDEPSKKGLKAYDRVMSSHEAAVKKAISELDKATQQFMENDERKAEQRKKTNARLERRSKMKKLQQRAEGAFSHSGCMQNTKYVATTRTPPDTYHIKRLIISSLNS